MEGKNEQSTGRISKGFLWGGAFAANQMEGAYDVGGKGLCIADINEFVDDIPLEKKYNGEVTTQYIKDAVASKDRVFPKRWGIDFYHTYKEDLKLLKELGLRPTALRSTGREFFRTAMRQSRMKRD